MNQSITKWFTLKSEQPKNNGKKTKKKSICVISTTSNSQNNKNRTKQRKRKRGETDLGHRENNINENNISFAKCSKRRKLENDFTVSRYGRKRKKVNYSLDSYWACEEKHNNNNNKNRKIKNKNKIFNVEQETEKTETFLMSKSERIEYERNKVMTNFKNELLKRHKQDKRLFAKKKANPYFNIMTNNSINNTTKNKIQYKYEKEAPLFPKISSIEPKPNPANNCKNNYNQNNFQIKCIDLIENNLFHNDVTTIEKQISDLLTYSPSPSPLHITATATTTTATITKEVKHATTNEEFCEIDNNIIKNELLFCEKSNTNINTLMWYDKYRPYSVMNIIGNCIVINELKNWLIGTGDDYCNDDCNNNYDSNSNKRQSMIMYYSSDDDYDYSSNDDTDCSNEEVICYTTNNATILTGPIACGKTTFVYAIAFELSYKVIEVNCVEIRTCADLNNLIGEATQSQQIAKSVIILFEEIDNILQTVPNITKTIIDFVNNSHCPIIFTAQNIPQSLESLNLTNFKFNYGPLNKLILRTYVIMLSQGIYLNRHQIEKIIRFFNNDLRSVLINLQFWLDNNDDNNNDNNNILHRVLDYGKYNIIFNSFCYWFINDKNSIEINPQTVIRKHKKSNCNPFSYVWTQSQAMVEAQNVINLLLNNICSKSETYTTTNTSDIEMREEEHKKENGEWLNEWCSIINTLSDTDILSTPYGSTLNTTYHYRLHPYTNTIFDQPLSNTITNDNNTKCQIYDTIQNEYLRQHILPHLMTLTINKHIHNHFNHQHNSPINNNDNLPLINNKNESNFHNFEIQTTKAWFDCYNEFITTICINEYHRKKEGGSQYRNGTVLRRSQRNTTFFKHILEEWIANYESQQIVEKWKFNFNGMGWEKNTLPLL